MGEPGVFTRAQIFKVTHMLVINWWSAGSIWTRGKSLLILRQPR